MLIKKLIIINNPVFQCFNFVMAFDVSLCSVDTTLWTVNPCTSYDLELLHVVFKNFGGMKLCLDFHLCSEWDSNKKICDNSLDVLFVVIF